MVFKPRLYKLVCPTFYMNTDKLDYTDSVKYLSFTFSSHKKDYNDMLRQVRILKTKSNRLLRLYSLLFNQWRSEGAGAGSCPGRRPEGGAKILPKNFF